MRACVCMEILSKKASNDFDSILYPTVFVYGKTIELGRMLKKIQLVGQFGATTGQCISKGMNAETVVKLLNSWH